MKYNQDQRFGRAEKRGINNKNQNKVYNKLDETQHTTVSYKMPNYLKPYKAI